MTPSRRPPLSRHARDAFTLVEVMVALSIIAVALVTLIVIRNNSVTEAQLARETTLITRLAQEKMGQLDVEPLDERADSGGFEDYPDIHWSKEVQLEVLETSDASQANKKKPELYRVTLTLTYPRGNEEGQYVITTYRLKKEDETPKEAAAGGGGGGGGATKGGGS